MWNTNQKLTAGSSNRNTLQTTITKQLINEHLWKDKLQLHGWKNICSQRNLSEILKKSKSNIQTDFVSLTSLLGSQ